MPWSIRLTSHVINGGEGFINILLEKKYILLFSCLNKIKFIILYNIRNSSYLCMTLNNQMKKNKAKLTNHCWICKHPNVWYWIDKTSGSWTEISILNRQVQITLLTIFFHSLFLSQNSRCVTPTKEMGYRAENIIITNSSICSLILFLI